MKFQEAVSHRMSKKPYVFACFSGQSLNTDLETDKHENVEVARFCCEEAFSKLKGNEGRIRCAFCKKRTHVACTRCNEEDEKFECEICITFLFLFFSSLLFLFIYFSYQIFVKAFFTYTL